MTTIHGSVAGQAEPSPADNSKVRPTGTWQLGGRTLTSRLITGTGGAASLDVMRRILAATGSQVTTVAMRRVGHYALGGGSLLDVIRQAGAEILPNTAGCHTAA